MKLFSCFAMDVTSTTKTTFLLKYSMSDTVLSHTFHDACVHDFDQFQARSLGAQNLPKSSFFSHKLLNTQQNVLCENLHGGFVFFLTHGVTIERPNI